MSSSAHAADEATRFRPDPGRGPGGGAERSSTPLSPADCDALFEPLRGASGILLAVSGGPDSVALMGLAAGLTKRGTLPPVVVGSVDHGLAPGSAAVAAGVVAAAEGLGFEAHLLGWEGEKPSTGIQEAAREARYALLVALAHRRGASHLVTAHTLDDQAETVLFRMARGSGPAGLAGMAPMSERDGVSVCRPFLDIPKQRLVETCRAAGWPYVKDPANADPRFARSRVRGVLPALAAEGLTPALLARLGKRLARDETALRGLAEECRERAALQRRPDRQSYAAEPLLAAPEAVLVRALDAVLTDFARAGPPRLGRLEDLAAALGEARAAGRPLRRTLHGCTVRLVGGGERLEFRPEGPRHRGTPAPNGGSQC